MLGTHLTDSDLIGLEHDLDTGVFRSCPGNQNAQPRLRTTFLSYDQKLLLLSYTDNCKLFKAGIPSFFEQGSGP